MVKVLFVCLGNICRSPLAEGIFEDLIRKRGLESSFIVDSAGTSGWHIDEPPDVRSIEIAGKYGIILDHLGRKLTESDLEKFDYILAMDAENYENILKLKNGELSQKARVLRMRDFDDERSGEDVPDPYFGGEDGFQLVYDMLEESLENFLDHIIKEHDLRK